MVKSERLSMSVGGVEKSREELLEGVQVEEEESSEERREGEGEERREEECVCWRRKRSLSLFC